MDQQEGSFGGWLRAALAERGMLQAQFAPLVPIDRGKVSKWVNNHERPRPELCEGIARALSVPVEVVLVRAGHQVEDTAATPIAEPSPDESAEPVETERIEPEPLGVAHPGDEAATEPPLRTLLEPVIERADRLQAENEQLRAEREQFIARVAQLEEQIEVARAALAPRAE